MVGETACGLGIDHPPRAPTALQLALLVIRQTADDMGGGAQVERRAQVAGAEPRLAVHVGDQDVAAPERALLDLHVLRDGQGLVGCLFQLVEGIDVRLFPYRRFFAGEAHGQEHEAIASHAESLVFAGLSEADLHLNLHGRKIALMEFG
ncbi:hypothetical protein D3C78_1507060 [compost metagenome]